MSTTLAAVVLNYKTPALTLRAVDALRAGQRPPDLTFLVDNGSGDGSSEALAAVPGARLIALEHNLGFSGGVNTGIRAALEAGAGRVVLVNSDARVSPDCLGTLEAELDRALAVGVVGPVLVPDVAPDIVESAGIHYVEALGLMRNLGAGKLRSQVERGHRTVSGVTGCVMMIRREVFDRIGLFEEHFFYSYEDLDFCLRARAAGFSSVCTADTTARHVGSASIGADSSRRLYFGARNQLLLASRARPLSGLPSLARGASISALNVAHALFTSNAPRLGGLAAVARGIVDHVRGNYGEGR